MNRILLTSQSVTYAKQMQKCLRIYGIRAEITRPDISLTKGNCAYAVSVSEVFLAEAIDVLRKNDLSPIRIILIEGENSYKELSL